MKVREQPASHWRNLIADALRRGVPVNECRVAAAMLIRPDLKGSRSLEQASGLARQTVLAVIPAEASELLQTITRGSSDFRNPEPIEVRPQHRHGAGHPVCVLFSVNSDQECVSHLIDSINTTNTHTRETAYLSMLDPHLDLWSNVEQASVGSLRTGSAGWALAVAYGGPEDVDVPLADVRRVLGLSERGTRAALRRLAARGVVSTCRRGRQTVVTVSFGRLASDEVSTTCRAGTRAVRAQGRQNFETVRVRRRRTPLGLIAWLTAKSRPDVPQDADPEWRVLVKVGTEEQIYDHLVSADKALAKAKAPPPADRVLVPTTILFQFGEV